MLFSSLCVDPTRGGPHIFLFLITRQNKIRNRPRPRRSRRTGPSLGRSPSARRSGCRSRRWRSGSPRRSGTRPGSRRRSPPRSGSPRGRRRSWKMPNFLLILWYIYRNFGQIFQLVVMGSTFWFVSIPANSVWSSSKWHNFFACQNRPSFKNSHHSIQNGLGNAITFAPGSSSPRPWGRRPARRRRGRRRGTRSRGRRNCRSGRSSGTKKMCK